MLSRWWPSCPRPCGFTQGSANSRGQVIKDKALVDKTSTYGVSPKPGGLCHPDRGLEMTRDEQNRAQGAMSAEDSRPGRHTGTEHSQQARPGLCGQWAEGKTMKQRGSE